ncbi:hypothetical protein VTO73DRAFT_15377 [Trametes versicolor]
MSESDVLYLVRTAHDGQSIHTLSSAVWLLYDLLTTFDQEVEFVWRSANTLPKFLYLVSRYVGIFGQFALASGLLPAYCNGQLITSLILDSCLILSVELSLMLRIDALYGRSKKVRTLLLVAFAFEAATAAAINGIIYPRIYAESRPFPSDWPLKGCFFPTDIFWNKLCWAPILVFETLLFCLNTAKCISYGRLEQTPLIYRLFRDGSAYFAIAFAFMLVCIVTQFLDVSWASTATSTWISAVFSYSGCHLLLSVRSVATRRERLDLTLLCAHASDTHNGHKSDSYLDGLYALDPPPQPSRHSFPHRIDSIELIPLPTFGSTETNAALLVTTVTVSSATATAPTFATPSPQLSAIARAFTQ